MDRNEILGWLREEDSRRLEELWQRADAVRRENVGDAVHLRGLIEFSNYCERACGYCGLRAANSAVERYRMTRDEVLECARQAARYGYGTVVLQSGEDRGIESSWVEDLVRRIKSETRLAITLSLGERAPEELEAWRRAGADRYLLRFETSNPALFRRIHPSAPGRGANRIELLHELRRLGYEVGSGVMVGIPGQTYDDLADDIEMFRALDLDMIGIGPFIPHPATPLGRRAAETPQGENQPPASELMTYKLVALARLAVPRANIPSTSALATLNLAEGRELGLARGANVVMPNLTPVQYRALYEIYPSKACIRETSDACHVCMKGRIASLGRAVGSDAGASPNWIARRETFAPTSSGPRLSEKKD